MALIVFMRGANVGGHRAFRPAALAKELSALDVVNVGAAGTFVVRKAVSQSVLRAELQRRLPFKAELMMCRARELVDLATAEPFPPDASAIGMRRFVSVLAKRPTKVPAIPFSQPAGASWQVNVVGLRGRFVLSLWRRTGQALLYPNEVVEKRLAVAATTRTWDTLTKICGILERR